MNDNFIESLNSLKDQIRPYLKDFLISRGIEVNKSGKLRCLNPMHNDETASMKLLSDSKETVGYCYGCNASCDIFQANHWITDVPIEGYSFIKDNVEKLAEEFKIPYVTFELSSEAIAVMEQVRLNRLICSMLIAKDEKSKPINWTHKHITNRGWSPEICEGLYISTILDYDEFIETLKTNTGLTREELTTKKDIRADLFGPEYITIPILNEKGEPVGFSARYLKWKKGGKKSKYSNSHNSITFKKSTLLYGMHIAKNSRKRLDVFEGYGSFIVAYGEGHRSCVSLCSSAMTQDQVELIKRLKVDHVNFVLDSDETGLAQTEKHMNMLSGNEGLKVSYIKLAFEGEEDGDNDPDYWIRKNGLGKFMAQKPIDAFEHFITKEAKLASTNVIDQTEFINRMIKIILNTSNRIERGRKISQLANATGVHADDIRAEVERISSVNVSSIKDDLSRRLSKVTDIDELSNILDKAQGVVRQSASAMETRSSLGEEECSESIRDLQTILRNRDAGIQGWKTLFPILDYRLSGIPKPMGKDDDGNNIPIPGSLIAVAGLPQHSKSNIIQTITYSIASQNDDAIILYWALDDSRERTCERIIANDSGVDWRAVTKRIPISVEDEKKVSESFNKLQRLVSDGRFIIKDRSYGITIPHLKRWIEYVQNTTDKPICIVIDSLHKIGSSGTDASLNDYSRMTSHSQEIKSLAQTHNLTIIASLELNKSDRVRGVEPDLKAIANTGKIEYDFDVIGIAYNRELDTDGQVSEHVERDGLRYSIIKLNIRKSKDGGGGPMYFIQHPYNFRLECYTLNEINALTCTEEILDSEVSGIRISSPDKGAFRKAPEKLKMPENGISFPWES